MHAPFSKVCSRDFVTLIQIFFDQDKALKHTQKKMDSYATLTEETKTLQQMH